MCYTNMSTPRYNSSPETLCDFRGWFATNRPLLERYAAQLNAELLCSQVQPC